MALNNTAEKDDKCIGLQQDSLQILLRRLVRGEDRMQLETTGFSCPSDVNYEVCLATTPVVIGKNASTIYIPSNQEQVEHKVQPYARKEDQTAMNAVTPVRILQGNTTAPPACTFTHNVPAVIFSSSGYTGNLFHEFNEIIIPLFITTRHFRSHLQFVITDFRHSWVSKYERVISKLSNYEVINPVQNGSVHCYPGAVIGLKYHDNLALNSTYIPEGYSMFDFKKFLRESYRLKIKNVSDQMGEKPVLVLMSRHETRKFLNEDKMVKMMEELGFQVIAATRNKTENLDTFLSLVNSCSVMVGAHGAGHTNALFLPAGAVMVQVVPLGLDWPSISKPEESSLIEVYGPDHPVINDPMSVFVKGYEAYRAVYVDGQNLKVNLVMFRETLVEAMKLLGGSSTPLN